MRDLVTFGFRPSGREERTNLPSKRGASLSALECRGSRYWNISRESDQILMPVAGRTGVRFQPASA
eukprot:380102-Rhodomonas_salina.1